MLINKSGQLAFTAYKTGFLNITFKDNKVSVEIDSKDHIQSKDLTRYYSKKTSFKVSVYDFSGKVVGKEVKFKINKKNYYADTDDKGVATLKLKLKPGKYTIYTYYGKAKVKNKIIIKKTLITKNLIKKIGKSAKFKVKLLNSKAKAYKNQIVKIKFNGKTYKLKTNRKGIATFTVPENLKSGKYKIKTSYNAMVNVNKITVKPVLKAKNISKKISKVITFKAKLVNSKGKPSIGKKITFKLKSKKYIAKTNKKGYAIIKIRNLKVGKYIIKTSCASSKISNRITVKK